ncbi:MAG: hypothetical protein K9N29_05740 [Candidatus Marinimicrobia bacterium]|nr:hypothetical protein [Candidatus Neomarinimicrobiota bacterium]
MKNSWDHHLQKLRNPWIVVLFMSTILSLNGLALEDMRPVLNMKATPDGVEIMLDFSHIPASQWAELLAHPEDIHAAGYGYAGKTGDPVLPQFTELIPISSFNQPALSIISRESYLLGVNTLKATPPGHLDTEAPLLIQNLGWNSSLLKQEFSVRAGEIMNMMGHIYLPVTIQPLSFDVRQKSINVPEKIVFQITGIRVGETGSPGVLPTPLSIIPNGAGYDQLGHYLIITPPLFEPYLGYLVDWKRRKGHPVTIVSTTVAGTSPTAIKAYIQSAYDTWEDPPKYVLLIGDEDRGIGGFYVYNPDNEALVTDHPYTLLDGEDTFPEAWVGRLSVDTVTELVTVIGKILSYESQPSLDDPNWFKRALLVATVNAAISTQQTNNWVGRKLEENGFVQIDTAYYPMQSSLSFISGPINAGVGFVNYRGLGAWDHWIGPYFFNSDIDLLHNGHKLPILTSIVCGGGNFAASTDPVFGEKWLRAGTTTLPRGAVAFIGPSEVHTHTQFNNVVDIALYSALFDLDMNELGPALWHAKLELWRNYYQSEFLPFGQSADFYLSVYNILGDPGMAVWTDTPQILEVDYPDTLDQNDDHLTVVVTDEFGQGVPDAFVYLYNANNAVGLQTSPSGAVVLPFIAGTETAVELTVTGRNLNPFLTSIPISNEEQVVGYHQWEIAPNGLLAAGAVQSMDLKLFNYSSELLDLTLTLSSSSTNCIITDSSYVLESFAGGDSIDLNDIFSCAIAAQAHHGDLVDFEISVDTGTEIMMWSKRFPIQAPDLHLADIMMEQNNFMAGDVISFYVNVENRGGVASPALTLVLLDQPLAWTSDSLGSLPSIPIDGDSQTQDNFTLVLSDQIFPGEVLSLKFLAEYAGRIDTMVGEITVENISRFSPSLADAYGYRVYDETDVSYSLAPDYQWLEINPDAGGAGNHLPIHDEAEEEDATVQLALPFPVMYYGQIYENMTVCSNGWLALGQTPEVSFYNRVIPAAEGPVAMIAPFWDDLTTNPGVVSYADLGDKFVVEWSGMNHLQVYSNLNFQVILYNNQNYPTVSGDNQIKMQFKDYHDYDTFSNFSTTGIEAPDYSTGLQVSFNNIQDESVGSMYSGRALLFTTERAQRFPSALMSLSQTGLDFSLNPWSLASDSIAITNSGGSPLVYYMTIQEDAARAIVANPLSGLQLVKGGPEPDGRPYIQSLREFDDYDWRNQDDPDGPVFDWRDISQEENRLVYTFDPDDSFIGPINIGFSFPFYTELYSSFYFSSNGTMSFLSQEYPWNNLTLPNGSAPAALIAPWWDDLNNNSGVQGQPYFWSNGLDTAIVTWDNFPKFGTDDFHTFQVIMVINGDIIMQYLEMEGARNVSTVGIQNIAKTKGIQLYFNAPNSLDAGDAIRISRQLSWLTVSDWAGVVEAGETGYFAVNVDTRNLEASSLSIPMMLHSNDPGMLTTEISVNLNVIHGAFPYGDINTDYQVNIIDVTTLIEFALELENPDAPQAVQADMNADGDRNVLDVILLLNLLLND